MAEGFDDREEGVTDLFVSTLRFLDGGAFFNVVAVPFLVFVGAGRFFEGAGFVSGTASVVGTGTEDSRKGDCVRMLCSFFREETALDMCCSMSGLRASVGDDGCGVGIASSFMTTGDEPRCSFAVE
jgi:hypothetical protein